MKKNSIIRLVSVALALVLAFAMTACAAQPAAPAATEAPSATEAPATSQAPAASEAPDPSRPFQVGACDTGVHATGGVVSGSHAFVICAGADSSVSGLYIFDVSDPHRPVEIAFSPSMGMPQDIVLNNNTIYIANESGMESIDVSNPAAPVPLGFTDFSGGDAAKAVYATSGVAVLDNIAYVTHATNGLEILDISNPHMPAQIGNFSSGIAKAMAITVEGSYAYISDDGAPMHIVDISDPKNPVEVGSYSPPASVEKMCLSGNMLYIADSTAGLLAVDVTDPKKPAQTGWLRLPGNAYGVTHSDNYIFVADGEGGLYIVEDSSKPGHEQLQTSVQPAASPEGGVYKYAQEDASPLPVADAGDPGSSGKTLKVTTAADSGSGSLREALEKTNKVGNYTITFDTGVFSPERPASIFLSDSLFMTGNNVTIDASNAGVILDGSKALKNASGLEIISDYNTVKGLQIVNFPNCAISIAGSYNAIGGDRSKGKGPLGEGNLLSGNRFAGINLYGGKKAGAPPSGNSVTGNLIGTDLSGNQAFGNQMTGIFIGNKSANNRIGGESEAERNIIGGNERADVSMTSKANRNSITGNYIGINAAGNALSGNALMGVIIEVGAYGNIVNKNVIGNNNIAGVIISDWGSWGNSVYGNVIGLDASGTVTLGGKGQGIAVNTAFNRVGGSKPEDKNIVSGNGDCGIQIGGSDVIVIGNYIGTDVSGTKVIGNRDGIVAFRGHAFIGGRGDGEQNLIGGNDGDGIRLAGAGIDNTLIFGNYIGTDRSGTLDLGNLASGIYIEGANYTSIQNNTIAHNKKTEILIRSGNNNQICYNDILSGNMGNDEGKNNLWDDGKEGNYWGN